MIAINLIFFLALVMKYCRSFIQKQKTLLKPCLKWISTKFIINRKKSVDKTMSSSGIELTN